MMQDQQRVREQLPLLQVLRENHFGQEEVRLRLREVALVATERINAGLLRPHGSVPKNLENLKIKALALQLPPRVDSLLQPAHRLLAWAAAERDADGGGGSGGSTA